MNNNGGNYLDDSSEVKGDWVRDEEKQGSKSEIIEGQLAFDFLDESDDQKNSVGVVSEYSFTESDGEREEQNAYADGGISKQDDTNTDSSSWREFFSFVGIIIIFFNIGAGLLGGERYQSDVNRKDFLKNILVVAPHNLGFGIRRVMDGSFDWLISLGRRDEQEIQTPTRPIFTFAKPVYEPPITTRCTSSWNSFLQREETTCTTR